MAERGNQGRTLERALSIINFMGEQRSSLKLSQIASGVGLHLATTQRMVNTLVEQGYLMHLEGQYSIGPLVLPLARAFTIQDRLSTIAYPSLVSLTQSTGLTASLYVRVGDSRVLVSRSEPRRPLRYQLPIGERMELTFGAGRVFLAELDSGEQDRIIGRFGPRFTYADGRSHTSEEFKKALVAIKEDGFYFSSSEREVGTAALNVPVRSSSGSLLAVVNMVAHDDAVSKEEIFNYRGLLLGCARAIGEMF